MAASCLRFSARVVTLSMTTSRTSFASSLSSKHTICHGASKDMNEAAANLSRPGVSSDMCSDTFMKAAQGDSLGDRPASAVRTHGNVERALLASLLTRLWSVARLAGGEMRADIAQKAEKSRVTDVRVLRHSALALRNGTLALTRCECL